MRILRFHTPLGLFSVLWALAACLHHLDKRPFSGLLIYPFAILLFLFPERIWAISIFAFAHILILWIDLPTIANHSILAILVNACLLTGCARLIYGKEAPVRRLWNNIRGPLQITLAVVYLFAVFHKLNTSFFDPEVSCATSQLSNLFAVHGFSTFRPDPSAFAFTIHLTLLFEVAIPVLLLWRRFTHIGALAGLAFHTLLSWANFYDFASVAFALYLFFFPWEHIRPRLAQLPPWSGKCFLFSFLMLCAASFWFHGYRQNPVIFATSQWEFRVDSIICIFWTAMLWPILLPLFANKVSTREEKRFSGTALAWLFPVLAVVNGATSYLGLKTLANYSMYSNLRTEGGITNHLLIPAGRFFLADYQNDLVVVHAARAELPPEWPLMVRLRAGEQFFPPDDPKFFRRNARWLYGKPGVSVPFAEIRRTLHWWKEIGITNIAITYERNGKIYAVKHAFSDPELMTPLPYWFRKFMAFRAVQTDEQPTECRW